jgi:hypothetical protein
MDDPKNHEFRINFSFLNTVYTASLTMTQKDDHDEYHITPDDAVLEKEYGSQTIDNYYNQKDPLRIQHIDNDYIRAVVKGVQEFLNSKHS